MDTVRIGVVGVGNIGTAHARLLAAGKIEGAALTAVCDRDAARREYAENTFLVPAFSQLSDMLNSGLVDAVLIATPHPLHAAMAAQVLQSGLHVLVEKPVDIAVSRARKLDELAQKTGRVFGMMFNQRTDPLFQKAREMVQSGVLGELKRTVWVVTNWYRSQRYYDSGGWRATWAGEGGGVLLNQAPHNLDLWQWICGMPVSVTAFCDTAKYHRIEVEDDVTLFARYENGATGTFITSTGEYPGTNRLEIVGDRGKLVLENGTLKWWQLAASEREVCFSAEKGMPGIDTRYAEWKPDAPAAGHAGILRNFVNAILHGEPLLAPGTDGKRELTLSNAAYLSEWTGNREITLPFDEEWFDRLLSERMSAGKSVEETSQHTVDGEYKERWQVRW